MLEFSRNVEVQMILGNQCLEQPPLAKVTAVICLGIMSYRD